jgi:hypothetical protein
LKLSGAQRKLALFTKYLRPFCHLVILFESFIDIESSVMFMHGMSSSINGTFMTPPIALVIPSRAFASAVTLADPSQPLCPYALHRRAVLDFGMWSEWQARVRDPNLPIILTHQYFTLIKIAPY